MSPAESGDRRQWSSERLYDLVVEQDRRYDERFRAQDEALRASFDAELKPLVEKLESMRRPNWPLMASVLSLFLIMVSGVWLIIGLKIDAVVIPFSIQQSSLSATVVANTERLRQVETVTAGSTSADVQSRTDRSQLNDRMRQVEATIGSNAQERRGQIQTINAKLVEIETQFCASDIVRNLTHASDMRITAILWHHAFPSTTMATDNALYPQICNRSTSAQEDRR